MPAFTQEAILAFSLLPLAGCVVDTVPRGPAEHESRSIEMDQSEMVRAQVKMGAGELRIRGGAAKLLEADFTYDVPGWKPEVHYDASSFRDKLVIEQPGSSHGLNGHTYEWDVRLNDSKPLDLEVHFGAGTADLRLGSLNLRSVTVNMGVGKLDLDLRGQPARDYDVRIHGGVGDATVYLPHDAGVIADAQGGIGAIQADGLIRHGSRYVNSAYEKNAKVNIRLEIHGGVGAIHLMGD